MLPTRFLRRVTRQLDSNFPFVTGYGQQPVGFSVSQAEVSVGSSPKFYIHCLLLRFDAEPFAKRDEGPVPAHSVFYVSFKLDGFVPEVGRYLTICGTPRNIDSMTPTF